MAEKRPVDIIREHYAASDRGDLEAMLAPLAPDVNWIEAAGFPYGGTYHGRDELVRGIFERLPVEWDDYRVSMREIVDGGDTITAIGTESGTYRRTGRFFTARVVHVWWFEDGLVAAFEQFADTELVNDALFGARSRA